MSDDLLEKATRALRETSAEPQPRSGLTRARILDSAEKRYASRRNFGLRWIIAIATALAASTALARVAQYWPEIKRALAPQAESAEPAPVRKPKPARTRSAPTPPPQPSAAGALAAPPVEPAPVGVAEAPPVAEAPKPRAKAAPRPPPATPSEPAPVLAPAPEAAPSAPPVESAELALFRRAQRLHRARDPRALGAWDDYLRVAGQGVLVPEARYNRALCLVRLGRKAEAAVALAPFAEGEYGNYRRAEAKALLDALR